MNLQNEKKACVLFRSVVEAAEELERDEALELLLTYAHIGLGDAVDLDNCSKVVRLILKQNIESLGAAERRYAAACENGPKGAEAGKENGGGIGRPRKGETKEEYQKRVEEWKMTKTPSKTPEKPPVNTNQKPPENPLEEEVEEEVYVEVEKKEYDKDKEEIYVEKNSNTKKEKLSEEEFIYILNYACRKFIDRHKDYNYSLENEFFKENYFENVHNLQVFVNEKYSWNLTIDDYINKLKDCYFETYEK